MASVGFDGSLRKWNLKNVQMEYLFEDRNATGADTIIQSVAWCTVTPPKGKPRDAYSHLVVVGTSAGRVKLIDLNRNKVISQFSVPDQANIFDLSWNSEGYLAVGCSGVEVIIRQFENDKDFAEVASLTVHCPCRCIAWNPINKHILACGLFNGNVLIYDNDKSEVQQILCGSEARVLCLQWHPQLDYILGVGSFDNVVRVHDIKFVSRLKSFL